MLSGTLPFNDAGVLEVLDAHVHREPPKPSARDQSLGDRVDAIILRGLAKNPEARWQTCDAFVSALEAALGRMSPAVVEQTVAMATPMPAVNGAPASAAIPVAATVAVAERAPSLATGAGTPPAPSHRRMPKV